MMTRGYPDFRKPMETPIYIYEFVTIGNSTFRTSKLLIYEQCEIGMSKLKDLNKIADKSDFYMMNGDWNVGPWRFKLEVAGSQWFGSEETDGVSTIPTCRGV